MKTTALGVPAADGVIEDLDLASNGDILAAVRSAVGFGILGAGWSVAGPVTPRFPLVRILNADRALLVDARTEGTDANAWILNREGEMVAGFFAGDAIADVRAIGDLIAFAYFDEAYGSDSPAGEGISVFDGAGRLLWGYRSKFGDQAVDTMDVYAACTDERGYLWFFPYTAFPLVRLDVHAQEQEVFRTPQVLRGSGALTLDGEVAYFANPYRGRGAVFAWPLEAPSARRVASIDGQVRGLSGGRFLATSHGRWTLVEDLFSVT